MDGSASKTFDVHDHQALDAERVSAMEFPGAANGYDREAVRAYLDELAEGIRAFKRADLAASRRTSLAADELKATLDGLMAVAESLESELSALGSDLQVSSAKIAANVRDLQQRMDRRLMRNGEQTPNPLDTLADGVERSEHLGPRSIDLPSE